MKKESAPMATLILEDGTRYEGTLFGHKAPVTGEVVFTTGMTGYQETLTDPSYCGQIVCMTYPLIGNVGINDIDNESAGVRMRGLIVSELCDVPSNWQMKKTLDQYLNEQGVTGLYGVDTRALTRHVREFGTLRGRIVEGEPTEEDIFEAASIAAWHSKAKLSGQVPVDYVRVKYVKKPNGAKPGYVIFTNNNTVYVTPADPAAAQPESEKSK